MEYPEVISFNYDNHEIRILKEDCRSKKYCNYFINLEDLCLDRDEGFDKYVDFQNKLVEFLHSQGFNCNFSEDDFDDLSYYHIIGLNLKLSFNKNYLKKLEAVNV